MGINKELENLYKKYWDDLMEHGHRIVDKKPTNPLLLKINEDLFSKSDLKIMIYGQETKGWHELATPIEVSMDKYEEFFFSKNPYNGYKKSAFWKAFNFFKKGLEQHHKEKELYFIWNNISKIGRSDKKTGVTPDIRNLERAYFPVMKEELLILKPDIIIFMTGGRDRDIKFHLSDITFKYIEMGNSKLAKRKYKPAMQLIDEYNYLPNKSVKVYHPSYFGGFNYIKNDALKFLSEA